MEIFYFIHKNFFKWNDNYMQSTWIVFLSILKLAHRYQRKHTWRWTGKKMKVIIINFSDTLGTKTNSIWHWCLQKFDKFSFTICVINLRNCEKWGETESIQTEK